MFGISDSNKEQLKRINVDGVAAELKMMVGSPDGLVVQVQEMNQRPMLRCFHVLGKFVSAPSKGGMNIDILEEYGPALVPIMVSPDGQETYYKDEMGVKVYYTDADVMNLTVAGYRKKTVTRSGKVFECLRCAICGAEEQIEQNLDMVKFLEDYIRIMNQGQRMFRQINYFRLQQELQSNESGQKLYIDLYGKKGQLKLYSKALFSYYMEKEIQNAKFQIDELKGVNKLDDDTLAGGMSITVPDTRVQKYYPEMSTLKQGAQVFNTSYQQTQAKPANIGGAKPNVPNVPAGDTKIAK